MFSVLIPTWNNLAYLKLCIASLRQNSRLPCEIIVHVNEGTDGTIDWLISEGIRHTHSVSNIGVCLAVNELAMHATQPWLVYLNDDMYCCPGWDVAFADAIAAAPSELAFFSSRLVEPAPSIFASVDCFDAGRTPDSFDAAGLLQALHTLPADDIDGDASQPTVVSRLWWHRLGGYGLEFSPGMCSDDDLLIKFLYAGCRYFRVVGRSRVYHFSQQSTGRIRKNKGVHALLLKWGFSNRELRKRLLDATGRGFDSTALRPSFPGRLRRAWLGLVSDQPLRDLERFGKSLRG